MKPYVLVLTHELEANVDIVIPMIRKKETPVIRINTDQFPQYLSLSLFFEDNTFSFLTEDGIRLSAENIQSCWYRQPWGPNIKKEEAGGYGHLVKEESKATIWSLSSTLDTFWMNSPSSVRLLDNNKFLQMKIADSVGFRTPASLITTNEFELMEFCERHGGFVALKMISGRVFGSESPEKFDGVYTQKLSLRELRERAERIKICPVFAQEYVEKKLEARITVVGKSIFPCAIYSQDSTKTLHDWRHYDFKNVKHEKLSIPDNISKGLRDFMERSNLSFGAFDFIITPQGEFVFLEVNTGGQWGWIEDLTGMPISETVADLLAHPSDL